MTEEEQHPLIPKIERYLKQDRDLSEMMNKILLVSDQIIEERGWSKEPRPKNFAWQLKGEGSPNWPTIEALKQHGILDYLVGRARRRSLRASISLVVLFDIPEVIEGAASRLESHERMIQFFQDFIERVGFLEEGETIEGSPRIRRSNFDKGLRPKWASVVHPQLPFQAEFRTLSIMPKAIVSDRITIYYQLPRPLKQIF